MRSVKNFEDVCTELAKVDDWEQLEQPANILADVGPARLLELYEPVHDSVLTSYLKTGGAPGLYGKATHAKIHVGGADPFTRRGFKLWVHDYRYSGARALIGDDCALADAANNPGAYVERWHTHRHNFVSIHGGGDGFTEDRVSPPASLEDVTINDTGFWVPGRGQWNPITRRYTYGDIMTIRGPLDIHRVYDAGRAVTFLVQTPNQNPYSQVYDEHGQPLQAIGDLTVASFLGRKFASGEPEPQRPAYLTGLMNRRPA